MHFKPCPLASGGFIQKFPMNQDFIWIGWINYNSSKQNHVITSHTLRKKTKSGYRLGVACPLTLCTATSCLSFSWILLSVLCTPSLWLWHGWTLNCTKSLHNYTIYRIGLNWTPVLNTHPPPQIPNRAPVKSNHEINTTPSRIEPHPARYVKIYQTNQKS